MMMALVWAGGIGRDSCCENLKMKRYAKQTPKLTRWQIL